MKILRCDLLAFGAFKDTSYQFESGVNVFEGLNETGKTTLLHFIEGMLYGFYSPASRNRRTIFPYERYVRSDGFYRGALTLEHDNKVYRIERDFKAHTVKVFLDATGQDITETLPAHPVWRQADLGAWLDMPYSFFVNSMRMTQTHLVPSDGASDFIAARLQNLDASGSETLSVTKALEYLSNKIKAIKNKGKTEAPLKEVMTQLNSLENTIKEAHQLSDRIKDQETTLQTLQQTLDQLSLELSEGEATLHIIQKRDAKTQFESVQTVFERHLKQKDASLLDQLIAFTNTFDTHQREAFLESIQTLKQAKTTLQMLEASQELPVFLDERTFKHQERAIFEWSTLEKTMQEAEVSLHALQLDQKAQLLESFEEELAQLIEPSKPPKPRLLDWFLIVPIVKFFKAKKAYRQAMIHHQAAHALLTRRKEEAFTQLRDAQAKAIQHEHTIKQAKEALETIITLHGFIDKQSNRAMERLHQTKKDSDRTQRLIQQQATLQATIKTHTDLLEPLTPWVHSVDLEALSLLLKTLEQLERQIKTDLTSWLSSLVLAMSTDIKTSFESQRATLENLKQNYAKTQNDAAHHQGTLQALEAQLPNLTALYGEKEALLVKRALLEKTLSTLERAKQKLEDAAQRNEDNFAPKMALHMSKVLKTLTLGRYDTLKIRRSLAFKVKGLEGDLKEATHFSTGTQDQVVLAIRLGLLKTLEKDHYPLFFDDVFAYFDEPRLKETLIYLATLNASQIFIFTAHTREKNHLDEAHIPYHLIQRTD